MGEFDLIARYFTRPAARAVLGVGDDCALLQPAARHAVGHLQRHAGRGPAFLRGRGPFHAGPQGAGRQPQRPGRLRRQTPGLHAGAFAAERVDEDWLAAFSQGLFALADAHGCELVGGDTTQGPLNICITVFGEVPVRERQRARRCCVRARKPGDDVYVSGTLGDARLALEALARHAGLAARPCWPRPANGWKQPDTARRARARRCAASPRRPSM
jgi:thiamine-monophosphate kinase